MVHTLQVNDETNEIHQTSEMEFAYPYSCNIMVLSNPVAFSRMVLTESWKSWLGGGNEGSLAYLLRKRSSRTFSLSMTDGTKGTL